MNWNNLRVSGSCSEVMGGVLKRREETAREGLAAFA